MTKTQWLAQLRCGDMAIATHPGQIPVLIRINLRRGQDGELLIDTNGMVWDSGQNEHGWRLEPPTKELLAEARKHSHRTAMRRKLMEASKTASYASLALALLHLNFDNKTYSA